VLEHQQTVLDGRVFSRQTLWVNHGVAADEAAARRAGEIYWEFLRRFGRPILRIRELQGGGVRVGLPGLLLLEFRPPAVVPLGDGLGLRYPIGRGAAVHPAHTGEGYLQMGVAPHAVSLTVEGYYPNLIRLDTRIYEWTQSALHLRVARGYLPLLSEGLRREANPPCST